MNRWFVIGCILLFGNLSAQDSTESRSIRSIYFTFADNPAYTGEEEKHVFMAGYQQYWPGLDTTGWILGGTPAITMLSYQYHFMKDDKARFGIAGSYEQHLNAYIDFRDYRISLSQPFYLGKQHLRIGLGMSYIYREFKGEHSTLLFPDQLDDNNGITRETFEISRWGEVRTASFHTGLHYRIGNLNISSGLQHITEPENSLINGVDILGRNWTTALSYYLRLNELFSLEPVFLIRHRNRIGTELLFAPTALYKESIFGTVGISNAGTQLLAGYQWKKFRIQAGMRFAKENWQRDISTINQFNLQLKCGI